MSSRSAVAAHDPRSHVIVRWDSPLATFFGEVYDTHERDEDGDPRCVVWAGRDVEDVVMVEALQARLEPCATLPEDLVVPLGVDQRQVTLRRPFVEIRRVFLEDREDQEGPFSHDALTWTCPAAA